MFDAHAEHFHHRPHALRPENAARTKGNLTQQAQRSLRIPAAKSRPDEADRRRWPVYAAGRLGPILGQLEDPLRVRWASSHHLFECPGRSVVQSLPVFPGPGDEAVAHDEVKVIDRELSQRLRGLEPNKTV